MMQITDRKMTMRAVLELAAPHTWSAAVAPVALGTALAAAGGAFSPGILLSTLCAAVLLQCGANTLNDYADFVKGTDTLENSADETDAALVYHGFDPKKALWLGWGFLLLALLAGGYTIWRGGLVPLLYGLVGGGVVLLYSGGRTPLSYLPVGEFISGVVMGGMITAACYAAQTGAHDVRIFYYALPVILTVGLIMLANNTSDVEKDRLAHRRTLPVLLGRRRAALLLKIGAVAAPLLVFVIVFQSFRGGAFLAPVLAVAVLLPLYRLLPSPVDAGVRGASMGQALSIHKAVSALYITMILIHLLRGALV